MTASSYNLIRDGNVFIKLDIIHDLQVRDDENFEDVSYANWSSIEIFSDFPRGTDPNFIFTISPEQIHDKFYVNCFVDGQVYPIPTFFMRYLFNPYLSKANWAAVATLFR